jgi:hypothetical protein
MLIMRGFVVYMVYENYDKNKTALVFDPRPADCTR